MTPYARLLATGALIPASPLLEWYVDAWALAMCACWVWAL